MNCAGMFMLVLLLIAHIWMSSSILLHLQARTCRNDKGVYYSLSSPSHPSYSLHFPQAGFCCAQWAPGTGRVRQDHIQPVEIQLTFVMGLGNTDQLCCHFSARDQGCRAHRPNTAPGTSKLPKGCTPTKSYRDLKSAPPGQPLEGYDP